MFGRLTPLPFCLPCQGPFASVPGRILISADFAARSRPHPCVNLVSRPAVRPFTDLQRLREFAFRYAPVYARAANAQLRHNIAQRQQLAIVCGHLQPPQKKRQSEYHGDPSSLRGTRTGACTCHPQVALVPFASGDFRLAAQGRPPIPMGRGYDNIIASLG